MLGIFGGFFLGKWDARRADVKLFQKMTMHLTKTILAIERGFQGQLQGPVSNDEIEKTNVEWYGSEIHDLQREVQPSLLIGVLLVIIALVFFLLPRFFGVQ